MTTLKKNMKPRILAAFDKLLLRKRCIIETINDPLKNIFKLEHSWHRSLNNYMINIVAGLVAYSYQDKLPSLNIAKKDLIPLFQSLIPNSGYIKHSICEFYQAEACAASQHWGNWIFSTL
ncbi:MAG: transposase [Thiotrichaceae bacterium]|nr:transposase [Thiotrichaceae bacterium]